MLLCLLSEEPKFHFLWKGFRASKRGWGGFMKEASSPLSPYSPGVILQPLDQSKTCLSFLIFLKFLVSLCVCANSFLCVTFASLPSDPFSAFPCLDLNSRGLIPRNHIFHWVQPMAGTCRRYMQGRKKMPGYFSLSFPLCSGQSIQWWLRLLHSPCFPWALPCGISSSSGVSSPWHQLG